MKKKYFNKIAYTILIAITLVVVDSLVAWTVPVNSPTNNNTDAPINIGVNSASNQKRWGGLGFTNNLVSNQAFYLSKLQIGGIPSSSLGLLTLVDGQQGVGKVLTSDSNGVSQWTSTTSIWTVASGNGTGNGSDIGSGINYGIFDIPADFSLDPITLPGGVCSWNGAVFEPDMYCVDVQKLSTASNSTGYQYYWLYYKCLNGYWIFDYNTTLKAPGGQKGSPYSTLIQPSGTTRCSSNNYGSSMTVKIKTMTVPQDKSEGYCVWDNRSYFDGMMCVNQEPYTAGQMYWRYYKCIEGDLVPYKYNNKSSYAPYSVIQPTGTTRCGQ